MVLGAEYQYEEVARDFGCPTGTIKSRVSRARRKILTRLSTEHGAEKAPAPAPFH
jgi:DNA-directed RNA polymerase specialized sigma24 family protein